MSITYWCWQSISLVTNTFKSCKNVVLCLCLDIYVSIKSKTVIIFKENVYMVLIVMATKWQLNRTKPHLLYEDRGILIMQFSYFSWQRNLHKTPNLVTGQDCMLHWPFHFTCVSFKNMTTSYMMTHRRHDYDMFWWSTLVCKVLICNQNPD